MMPVFSARIGAMCGSHTTNCCLGLTFSPLFTATVAPRTDAARALARERAAHADRLELQLFELVRDLVADERVLFDDGLIGDRIADRVAGRAPDDQILQFDLDGLALVNRRLGDSV